MRVCHGPPNLPIYSSYRPRTVFAKTASQPRRRTLFSFSEPISTINPTTNNRSQPKICGFAHPAFRFSAASRNLLFSSFCFLVLVLSRPFAFSSLCFLVSTFSAQITTTSKTTANGYRRSTTSETTANGYRRSLPAKQPLMGTEEVYQQNNR